MTTKELIEKANDLWEDIHLYLVAAVDDGDDPALELLERANFLLSRIEETYQRSLWEVNQ